MRGEKKKKKKKKKREKKFKNKEKKKPRPQKFWHQLRRTGLQVLCEVDYHDIVHPENPQLCPFFFFTCVL